MNDIYIYDIEVLADRYEEEQAILLEINELENLEKKKKILVFLRNYS